MTRQLHFPPYLSSPSLLPSSSSSPPSPPPPPSLPQTGCSNRPDEQPFSGWCSQGRATYPTRPGKTSQKVSTHYSLCSFCVSVQTYPPSPPPPPSAPQSFFSLVILLSSFLFFSSLLPPHFPFPSILPPLPHALSSFLTESAPWVPQYVARTTLMGELYSTRRPPTANGRSVTLSPFLRVFKHR